MQRLDSHLKSEYGYSDYEIAVIKYIVISIFSELSKLFIMGCPFFIAGLGLDFLTYVVVTGLLRINGGGIHLRHYITCLMLSSFMCTSSTLALPYFSNKLIAYLSFDYIYYEFFMIFVSIICMIIQYIVGPVASIFRPSPDSLLIKSCKNNCAYITFGFILIVMFVDDYHVFRPYVNIAFWCIVLHTLQLYISKKM